MRRSATRLGRPRPWAHWTLRSRLVLVIAVLATVALVSANAAGLVLLRSYLTQRVDAQLVNQSRPFAAGLRVGAGPTQYGGTSASNGWRGRFGPDQFLDLYRADGTVETARGSATGPTAPLAGSRDDAFAHANAGRPYTVTGADGATPWRLLAVPIGDTGGVAVVGASLAEVAQTADRLLLIDVAVTVTVLVLLVLLAASVVRLGLRPLTRMEQVAAKISAGDLARRVDDTDTHTEPGRLGAAVNLMLTRIETEMSARDASERRLRQFVADASHELRTPLTSIRGFAELYRRGGSPPGPLLDETMSRIEAEAARMGVLVEDLLLLARLDRQRPPVVRPVDLLEIAADTIRDAYARVPDRPVRLAALHDDAVPNDDAVLSDGAALDDDAALDGDEATLEPPTVLGDEHRLRQVAANLVANALQHTPPDGRVTVRIGRAPAGGAWRGGDSVVRSGPVPDPLPACLAVLEVVDDGPGVPAEHAGRVFERLYRADPSRSRGRGGGSGLGLSIVASIVHAHGGWVELDSTGASTTFRVLLPMIGSPSGATPPVAPVPSKL